MDLVSSPSLITAMVPLADKELRLMMLHKENAATYNSIMEGISALQKEISKAQCDLGNCICAPERVG